MSGPYGAGTRLRNIDEPYLGIDNTGNLLLDTVGKMAGQEQSGLSPLFGGKGIPTNITITNTTGPASNECDVTFQATDVSGVAVAGYWLMFVYLSDSAAGAGKSATAPSGALQAETSGGTVMTAISGVNMVVAQTDSAGAFVLRITDTAKTLYYPCAYMQDNPNPIVGAQLTSGSYHA